MDLSRSNTRGTNGDRPGTTIGRVRTASVSVANKVLELNPQPGMWYATGTAIARAPNITDLQAAGAQDKPITFDNRGHGTHKWHRPHLHHHHPAAASATSDSAGKDTTESSTSDCNAEALASHPKPKPTAGATIKAGLVAAANFLRTPTGIFIAVYGLNVVAWGAMLFFLLLKAAPAMDHPDDGDADSSPRKIWIEIDSQILNALFCLTSFGLFPWRFRDLVWCIRWRHRLGPDHGRNAIHSLAARNAAWFRMPPELYEPVTDTTTTDSTPVPEFLAMPASGVRAPPTKLWKLIAVVWLMIFNSLFQVGMATMMWHWNRIDRPSWGTGLFIGLGCASALIAGLISWWEGRKVKKIEGLIVQDKADC